jgi:hypothetical protein
MYSILEKAIAYLIHRLVQHLRKGKLGPSKGHWLTRETKVCSSLVILQTVKVVSDLQKLSVVQTMFGNY